MKNFEEDDSAARVTDILSPTDGKPLRETLRGYKSQDGELMVYKVIAGRKMEEAEVRELVAKGVIGPLDGFVSAKTRNRFAASLRLVKDAETGQVEDGAGFRRQGRPRHPDAVLDRPPHRRRIVRGGQQLRAARARRRRAGNRPSGSGGSCARSPSRREQAIKLIARGQNRPDPGLHFPQGPAVRRLPQARGRRGSPGSSRRGRRSSTRTANPSRARPRPRRTCPRP